MLGGISWLLGGISRLLWGVPRLLRRISWLLGGIPWLLRGVPRLLRGCLRNHHLLHRGHRRHARERHRDHGPDERGLPVRRRLREGHERGVGDVDDDRHLEVDVGDEGGGRLDLQADRVLAGYDVPVRGGNEALRQ